MGRLRDYAAHRVGSNFGQVRFCERTGVKVDSHQEYVGCVAKRDLRDLRQ